MDKSTFGKRLQRIRKERQLTSEELSELCDVSPIFIRQIECATRLPALPNLVKLCNGLHVSADYLLADSLTDAKSKDIDALDKRLKSLSPKQLELTAAVINTLIDNLKEQEDSDRKGVV